MSTRLTIIGNRGGTNVGASLERAAVVQGLDVQVIEPRQAMEAPSWLRRFNWHLRGHRPTWLNAFSMRVVDACLAHKSQIVIVTGICAVNRNALLRLRAAGVTTVNYLTDDPWNPAHKGPWFLDALPEYVQVFSPRRANLRDLKALGCREVTYLPFAYDPDIHFVELPELMSLDFETDVLFVGGADSDRVPICAAIAEAGLSLTLYGDYWDRFKETRQFWKGHADPPILRKATAVASVCLCLTRWANRDDHTMRSYEAAAMAGVLLAEDTEQHRNMFGTDGEGALFFRDIPEMITRAKWLMMNRTEARRMAGRAFLRITSTANTYADRLLTMMGERVG